MRHEVLYEFVDKSTGKRHKPGPTDEPFGSERAAELVRKGLLAEVKGGGKQPAAETAGSKTETGNDSSASPRAPRSAKKTSKKSGAKAKS